MSRWIPTCVLLSATAILGAWGCGAFGIETAVMAGIFYELLTGTFAGAFQEIVFAITDWSEEQRFIGPFRQVFEA